MRRRYFLPLLTSTLASPLRGAKRKVVVMLVDGFGPEYVDRSDMPNLKRMAKSGHFKIGKGVIPSVTNVNNASLVTGTFPSQHGITTNFYFDPATHQSKEMESAEFLLRPTIFEKARTRGWKSALVTSKDKVRTLCARGVDMAFSAEKPPSEWVAKVGAAESMYSAAVNYWTLRAARHVLKQVDLLYLSTTDYMMHTYAPESPQSLEHLNTLDRLLGEIINDHPGVELYLTADHGMNAKPEAVDISRVLASKGIAAESVPIIRDKHKVHHGNLGGACYVYLDKKEQAAKAMELLKHTKGVDEVFSNADAARLFRLHSDRIGDLFLLGRRETAFGELQAEREQSKVRTHGSRYEAQVPLLIYGRKVDFPRYEYNVDLTRYFSWD